MVNGDFSQGTTGWSFASTCFSIDPTTLAPNGGASLLFDNPPTCSHTPIAVNSLKVSGGQIYTFSGQMKTEDFSGVGSGAGAIAMLYDFTRSPIFNGTVDWTNFNVQHVTIPEGRTPSIRLQTYDPVTTGSAWFANIALQEEIPPGLQTFLLYPNYRGLMFSDQSQVASLDLIVTPPAGTSLTSLQVEIDALDAGGNIVASQTFAPATNEFTGTLDLSALPAGSYQLVGKLDDTSGNVLMTQSAYTIVKLDASVRTGMKAWIDPANRAHFGDGNPHFVLGIYDTTGYSDSPAYYSKELAAIAQAPINMLINYYITNAPTQAIAAYLTAMKQFGITFLPDMSGYYTGGPNFPIGVAKEFGTNDPDTLTTDYVSAFTSNPGVVGYYVQDEPAIGVQPRTFNQYSLIKASDPSGFNFAVLNRPFDIHFWKDTVDVLGVDPYPIAYADTTRNDLAEVADWTRAAYQAGHGARPVWTVIQFFQADLESVWPTQDQLHDMSWMAIIEGASGLFYWEYGLRGLYLIKDPVEHAALYQELINVTTEIKSLEPILLSPDAPMITANSEDGTVFTRTKVGIDGTRYLFAYNYTASPVTTQFTLAGPATSILDYDTGTTCAPATSTTFYGVFLPYQAHVFLVGDSASATPAACATPSATPSTTPTPTLTPTASATAARTPVRTGTPTATASASATSTSTATATASATPTATATAGALSVSPTNLKFNAQRVGTSSRARTLKVRNAGAATVTFNGMLISGDFAQTDTCGASLTAQNSCTFSVTFKPTALGRRTGNLPLHDNASNSPQIVTLSGKGNRH
jgi:Abnormal spindle-like microcephaly-assoc'd, ASPM-SPD-2-Hydin